MVNYTIVYNIVLEHLSCNSLNFLKNPSAYHTLVLKLFKIILYLYIFIFQEVCSSIKTLNNGNYQLFFPFLFLQFSSPVHLFFLVFFVCEILLLLVQNKKQKTKTKTKCLTSNYLNGICLNKIKREKYLKLHAWSE